MSAFALPVFNPVPVSGGELSSSFVPITGSGSAMVISTVYLLEPAAGGYLYTYQITDATAKFTWFSVALNSGTSIIDWGIEATGTMPINWLPVEDALNPNSIEAFFNTGLTSGDSALLWFTSLNGPTSGDGALARLSATSGAYSVGSVLIPVPEPLTVTLLGFGWIAVRSFKRKK
jgi:hypothetical protein